MDVFNYLNDQAREAREVEILNENCEILKLLEEENLSKVARLGSKALLRVDVTALLAYTSLEDRSRLIYLLKIAGFT